MKTLALMLLTALIALGQSPVQHVTQGDLEVYTGPYSNFPDDPGNTVGFFPESQRVYGLWVIISDAGSSPDAYRIEVELTLADGTVVHVNESHRAYWGTWYIVSTTLKSPVVSIAHLVITKQREDAPVEVPLAVPDGR